MAARRSPPLKVYRIGYYIGSANKVTEILVRGMTSFYEDASSDSGGYFGLMDTHKCVVFAIPLHSLVYCIVDAACPKPRKSEDTAPNGHVLVLKSK